MVNVFFNGLGLKSKNDFVIAKTNRIDVSKELRRVSSSRAWLKNLTRKNAPVRPLIKRPELLPDSIRKIRIAGVLDTFTESCLNDVCEVKNLSVNNYRQEIDEFNPHFLLIESAWRGKDEGWKLKVSNPSSELIDLTDFCHSKSIPIAFWNKEDPIHFKEFLGTARMCDYVFTTDIDSIANYKEELNHENVHLLPFGAAPGIHNPIEKYERKMKFSFAGSYYVRYDGRKGEFDQLFEICALTTGIDIFDRNYKTANQRYKFPEKYQPFILGTLPYEEIDKAYKGYVFGLNVNSVKNSQTMFARRVFEQMACNCITVTGYSRAIRNFFGETLLCSSDQIYLKGLIESLIDNPNKLRKMRLIGLRSVYSNHLYIHRIEYLAEKIFDKKYDISPPSITVISDPVDERQVQSVLINYFKQTHVRKKLLLITDLEIDSKLVDESVIIMKKGAIKEKKLNDVCDAEYISYFSPKDYYGKNYLTDLVLTRYYFDADVIGKASWYQFKNSTYELIQDGRQYKRADSLYTRSCIISRRLLEEKTLHQLLNTIQMEVLTFENMFSVDEMNYCRDWEEKECSVVDDLLLKDYGMPLDEIYRHADSITTHGRKGNQSGMIIEDFNGWIEPTADKDVKIIPQGNEIVITSTLPAGKWVNAKFLDSIPIDQVTQTDVITSSIKVEVTGKLYLSITLVCLGEDGNKITSFTVKPGISLNDIVPVGTKKIHPWLRISGSGNGIFKSLSFDRNKSDIEVWLGKTPNLLITNGYPSYDDLYQKVFVHKRVVGYLSEGIPIDVFCFNPTKEQGYREFEGIPVTTGSSDLLRAILDNNMHKQLLVHFLTPDLWQVLKNRLDNLKLTIWIHGAEIQPWHRRQFNFKSDEDLIRAKELSESRMKFWKMVLGLNHPNIHFVFISQQFFEEATSDIGVKLDKEQYSIIHNFVDADLFNYTIKKPELRTKVLSIRPFASAAYANDLSVKAIVELSKRPYFKDLEFRIIGDGELFEETVAPLREFPNVIIEQKFLQQGEIATLHKQYGVFLVPSRMDTQGVSRDEAMSSGLVPVTNRVAAIPEFVDDACAILAEAEDYMGLADGIERLYKDPDLFLRMSKAASERVRNQSSKAHTIMREIELIHSNNNEGRETVADNLEQEVHKNSEIMAG